MVIEKNKMVSIHYTLKDKEGAVLDSSAGGAPLDYLHGYGNLIPGLEKALTGKKSGDVLSVSVEPAEAYGEYSDDLVVSIPRSNFETEAEIKIGMQFETGSGALSRIVRVTKIDGDTITVDANHELAGKTLFFDVTVHEVRDASPEEINAKEQGCSCGCSGDSCSGGGCGGCSGGSCCCG